MNRQFLDQQIQNKTRVVLASPAAKANGFYAWEISYLRSKGFRVSKDGLEMVRP